jgi:hypothetical protein
MENYIMHDTSLEHDGGSHNLEVEIEGNQAVIRFGASFTLRMSETQIDKLREILYETSRELCINRRDTTGVYDDEGSEERYNAVNDAMDALSDRVMKETQATAAVDPYEPYNPNDPANW